MGTLSRDDVLKIAKLARLQLTDSEIDEYSTELSAILQYVEMLQTIDVTDLKATNQVTGLVNVTRADEVVDYGYKPQALYDNVPTMESDQIKVQLMIT